MSNGGGDCELTETVGSPTSIADIWLGLTLVETNCGAGAESYGNRKGLLAIYIRLLEIFFGGHVCLGYLGQDRRRLRTSMP